MKTQPNQNPVPDGPRPMSLAAAHAVGAAARSMTETAERTARGTSRTVQRTRPGATAVMSGMGAELDPEADALRRAVRREWAKAVMAEPAGVNAGAQTRSPGLG